MATPAKTRTVWFGMELTPDQMARIKRFALREQTTAKQAILDLVDRALQNAEGEAQPGSFLDGLQHLVGSVEGPEDLSTHVRHMEGFGR